jgi:hypothetical protein
MRQGYTSQEDLFIARQVKSNGAKQATWKSIVDGRDWGETPPSAQAIKVRRR